MAIAHVWPSHAIVRYDDLWLLTLEGTDGLRWTRCVNSDCSPALGCRRCRAAMERPRSLRRYFSSFPPDAASVHMLATRMCAGECTRRRPCGTEPSAAPVSVRRSRSGWLAAARCRRREPGTLSHDTASTSSSTAGAMPIASSQTCKHTRADHSMADTVASRVRACVRPSRGPYQSTTGRCSQLSGGACAAAMQSFHRARFAATFSTSHQGGGSVPSCCRSHLPPEQDTRPILCAVPAASAALEHPS